MKALSEYLKAPVPAPIRREQGAQDLRKMISGRMKRQAKKAQPAG